MEIDKQEIANIARTSPSKIQLIVGLGLAVTAFITMFVLAALPNYLVSVYQYESPEYSGLFNALD